MSEVFLSIVVPCLNEEASISDFYNDTLKICETLKIKYEIIFIDDGSTDNTLEKMRKFKKTNNNVHYVSFYHKIKKFASYYCKFVKFMI